MNPGLSDLYSISRFLVFYVCLQKAIVKQAGLAFAGTLTIEEWKAEQQLGGRKQVRTQQFLSMRLYRKVEQAICEQPSVYNSLAWIRSQQ